MDDANQGPVVVIDERFEEFVPALMKDIRRSMESIKERCAEEEFGGIEDIAHEMRGASGTLGFDQVEKKAGGIEEYARDEDVEGITSKADEIIGFLDEVTVRYE